MIPLQRVVALLMAAALVFVFLVPLGMRRHQYGLVIVVVAIFFVYVAVNAWLFVRMRGARKE